MKLSQQYTLIGSYLFLLAGCYLFDWKPLGIFFSYLLELVILLLVYSIVRLLDKQQRPQAYRKQQPLINVLIGAIPLVLFQYFIILLTAGTMDPDPHGFDVNLWLRPETIYSAAAMLLSYGMTLFSMKGHAERVDVFRDNFLFKCLSLTIVNLVGMVVVLALGEGSLWPVLIIMTALRCLLELRFAGKMRFV